MEKSDYTAAFRRDLGARIRACRVGQGLSLRKLGLMTGIDYAYLSTIENGSANTTVDTLLKICDALDVELTVVLSPRATA